MEFISEENFGKYSKWNGSIFAYRVFYLPIFVRIEGAPVLTLPKSVVLRGLKPFRSLYFCLSPFYLKLLLRSFMFFFYSVFKWLIVILTSYTSFLIPYCCTYSLSLSFFHSAPFFFSLTVSGLINLTGHPVDWEGARKAKPK